MPVDPGILVPHRLDPIYDLLRLLMSLNWKDSTHLDAFTYENHMSSSEDLQVHDELCWDIATSQDPSGFTLLIHLSHLSHPSNLPCLWITEKKIQDLTKYQMHPRSCKLGEVPSSWKRSSRFEAIKHFTTFMEIQGSQPHASPKMRRFHQDALWPWTKNTLKNRWNPKNLK